MKKARNSRRIRIAVLSLLLAAMSAVGAGFGITAYFMDKNFGRCDDPPPNRTLLWHYEHYRDSYPAEEVSFTSGDNVLKGRIYGMDNTKALIVFAHGIGGGHEGYMNVIIDLIDRGYRVFAYDATGCGRSSGEGIRGLGQSVIDLDNALTFAEKDERLNGLPTVVLGHSWGGYAAAAVLNYDHDVKACVTLSGYNTPYEELTETADKLLGKASKLTYPFVWCWNRAAFGSYADDSGVDGINRADIPVLIVHGTQDDTIDFNGAAIMAHRELITNPRAEYYVYDEEHRHNHNDFFTSDEYLPYRDDDNARAAELRKQYDGNVPDEAVEAFNATVDAELYNTLNTSLMDMIDDFYMRALS